MFRVVLGLIAVVLFAGLALAGASFFGSRFTSASAQSAASAASQQLQQGASALQMYRLKTGSYGMLTMGNMTAYVPRYLKSIPVVPTPMGRANAGSYLYSLHVNNDVRLDNGDEGAPQQGRYLMFALGTDAFAQKVCQTVADAHQGGVIPSDVNAPTGQMGCMAWTGGPWVLWQAV